MSTLTPRRHKIRLTNIHVMVNHERDEFGCVKASIQLPNGFTSSGQSRHPAKAVAYALEEMARELQRLANIDAEIVALMPPKDSW